MNDPETIVGKNLSRVWGKVFLRSMALSSEAVKGCPILISIVDINNQEPDEDPIIRLATEQKLDEEGLVSISDTAFTIFPYEMWKVRNMPDRAWLFNHYLHIFPRIKARSKHKNKYGTYFERMIRFRGQTNDGKKETKNQIEHLLELWENSNSKGKSPRASAMLISCFDPIKDHTTASRRPFPCLQQVNFSIKRKSKELAINALYPSQFIFDRGYGNYLGLWHLGLFMAHEMGLTLNRLNCCVINANLGTPNKGLLRELEKTVKKQLSVNNSDEL